MRGINIQVLVMAAALAASLGAAQKDAGAAARLQAGINKETVEGGLRAAIELYRQLAGSTDRVVAAKALVRMGQCHEKLGEAEARQAYERAIRDFADQAEPAGAARARLAALNAEADDGRLVVRKLLDGPFGFFQVSHDGQYLPFEREGDTFVRDLATKTDRLVVASPTVKGQVVNDAILSHDNGRLAYVKSDWLSDRPRSRYELRVVELDGGADRLLFEDKTLIGLWLADWSPASNDILAVAVAPNGDCQFLLVDARSGSRRGLYELEDCRSLSGQFTPDGQQVVFSPQTKAQKALDILSIPIRGGEPQPVVMHPADDRTMGWAADGRLVFRSDRSGTQDIWAVPFAAGKTTGEPELLKRDIGKAWPRGFSPDGSFVYQETTNKDEVYEANLDADSGRLVSAPAAVSRRYEGASYTPDFSRDGRFLAYATGPRDSQTVRIRDLSTGNERDLPAAPLRSIYELTWFPDGRAILLQGDNQERESVFYKIDAQSGQGSVLLTENVKGDGATNPTFDPTGEWLYFKARPDEETKGFDAAMVVRYHLASGKMETVAESPGNAIYRMFALSPDGERLVVNIRSGAIDRLAVIPVNGGEPETVFTYEEDEWERAWGALEFTADGNGILHQRQGAVDGTDQLLLTSLAGGGTTKLADTGIIHQITVHPDGRRITWWARDLSRELWVMENLVPMKDSSR